MQRLGGARLLHVPVFPVRPPSNIRVRFKHKSPWSFTTSDAPLRSNYKTFEASTLVLDLDAEDSPYVRPYNDDVDGVPAYKSFHMARNLDPMKERVAQFNELSRNYRKFSKMTASKKFSPWRISDHDILSVALNNSSQNEQVRRLLTESDYDTLSISLDNSSQDKQVQRLSTDSDPNSHPDEIANDVLKWNGIPFHVWNSSSKTIAYMRRRQQLSYRLQPIVDDEKSLIDALWACTNFPIFERLVTSLVQAPQGCQLVSNCGKNIGQRCKYLAKKTPSTQVLSFLNNLIINLDSQGLPISTSIIWCAYLSSLRCGAFSTTQKHLRRIYDNKHSPHGTQVTYTLEVLAKSIAPYDPEDIRAHPGADTVHQLLAIYGLLTGRVLGENTVQPSLDDIVLNHGSPSIFTYLTCLARLGAFRTMWHIWHKEYQYFANDSLLTHTGSTSESNLPDTAEKPGDAVEASDREALSEGNKALAFAHAIHAAIRTNNRFVELAETPGFARATEQYNMDCQLDMDTIINSADIISARGDGQLRQVEGKEMNEIFNKSSTRESLLALQSYLRRVPIPESG